MPCGLISDILEHFWLQIELMNDNKKGAIPLGITPFVSNGGRTDGNSNARRPLRDGRYYKPTELLLQKH